MLHALRVRVKINHNNNNRNAYQLVIVEEADNFILCQTFIQFIRHAVSNDKCCILFCFHIWVLNMGWLSRDAWNAVIEYFLDYHWWKHSYRPMSRDTHFRNETCPLMYRSRKSSINIVLVISTSQQVGHASSLDYIALSAQRMGKISPWKLTGKTFECLSECKCNAA